MSRARLPLVVVLVAAVCGCSCGPGGLDVRVRVVGQGQVAVAGSTCSTECDWSVAPSTPAVATAADGWRFTNWSGLCEGTGSCTITSAGELTANFIESSVVLLTVTGPGGVLASDGRRCASGETCRWATTSAIGLTPLPASGSEFVGYSGACTGTARCTLSAGAVQATFRESGDLIDFQFTGNGSGVVRDLAGDYSCNQSCTLRVPSGAQLEFRATPAAGSVFGGFAGGCTGSSCTVAAPASVQVRFDTGRRVVVDTLGNGGGTVAVNGADCTAPCDVVLPVDAPVSVSARPDETSRFLGFSGDCAGASCSVTQGTTDVLVHVEFESVLRWVRSFPIPSAEGNNVALFADDRGIYVAASVRGSMEIDGRLYAEPFPNRNGSPYFIELGWDAGVQSVLPFYDYVDGGYTRTDVASLTKGPDGTLFAFGVCFQGHFLGQPCGALNISDGVPFVVEIQDGGVRSSELRIDLQDSDNVGFLDSHLVGDSLVARVFRHEPVPNRRSGFYVRARGADAGTVTLADDLWSIGGPYAKSWGECSVDGESLVCLSPVTGAFVGLGCAASSGGMLARYRYTPGSGACELEWRMPAGLNAAVRGVARSGSGSLQAIGKNADGAYDFGSGFTLSGPHDWVVGLDGGSMSYLTSSPSVGQLSFPVAIVAANSGVLVFAKTGPLQPGPSGPLFGIPLTVNDSAYVLTFDESGRMTRQWPLLGGAANHAEIYNGTMTRVGEDIVVAVMGSGYTFRGQPLAPDLQMRLFVMVFRE